MNDDIFASTVVETVIPRGMHAYLAAHGWTRTGTRTGPYRIDRGDVYRRSGDATRVACCTAEESENEASMSSVCPGMTSG